MNLEYVNVSLIVDQLSDMFIRYQVSNYIRLSCARYCQVCHYVRYIRLSGKYGHQVYQIA